MTGSLSGIQTISTYTNIPGPKQQPSSDAAPHVPDYPPVIPRFNQGTGNWDNSGSNGINKQSATVQQSAFILNQFPEPLPPGLESMEVLPHFHRMSDRSATIKQSAFLRKQYPEPLPPGLGSVDVFAFESFISQQSAVQHRSQFILGQFPPLMPSKIGEEDLPGGFRKESILNGQKQTLYGLVHGIIEIEDVKVLVDLHA
jgi:hypothetical protein